MAGFKEDTHWRDSARGEEGLIQSWVQDQGMRLVQEQA